MNIITHYIKSFLYSIKGFMYASRHESAYQVEFAILIIIIPIVYFLNITNMERLLLIGVWILVLVLELLNSSIEATVDRISKRKSKLSGRAKDLSSASVTLMIVLAVLTWILVLI